MNILTSRLLGGILALVSTSLLADTAQMPLHLSSNPDPNVLFNLSVESPMGGAAYNDQPGTFRGGSQCDGRVSRDGGEVGICYFPDEVYLGYFDPGKCYSYDSSEGYFQPETSSAEDHSCSGRFSGNFMNWASMTATDTFVWALTGGNRVVDALKTVVERARKTDNDNWFPHKYLNTSDNVSPSSVTPFPDSEVFIGNTAFGINFGSARGDSDLGSFNLRVRLCDVAVGLESNCVIHGDAIKPEGLIQTNAESMRFAVTSYSLDDAEDRDGGILRANMKYVGPLRPDGSGGMEMNPAAEVNFGGMFLDNPEASAAASSGVGNSGVINYINRFSEAGYKSKDPASELYYESLRYFKNLGPTPEYSEGLTTAELGGFPAITDWQDPVQYACQKNFILGINDANPWLDKSLPGTFFTNSSLGDHNLRSSDWGEPSNADPDIDARALTNRVGELEGLEGTSQCIGYTAAACTTGGSGCGSATDKNIPGLGEVMGTCPHVPKENSYYIAGLAHYANTHDLRDDFVGEQQVSSFFVDTQEFSENPLTGQMNMLWLAGKYGGFEDINDNDQPDLAQEWDRDENGEPDNYVLASRPDRLLKALNRNFAEIEARSSSVSAVTTSSTQLGTDTRLFQARFNSGDWSGQLLAFDLDAEGSVAASPAWDAAQVMPAPDSRNILSWNGSGGFAFTDGNLSTINSLAASAGAASLSTDQVNYLRGDTSQEERNGGALRDRSTVLGDIVNSDPLHLERPNFGYSRLPGTEGTAYSAFRSSASYLARPAMVYVGANDGMLHGFEAATGIENLAFVPESQYDGLGALTDPEYEHRFFVDGSPTAGDAYFDHDNDSSKSWRTVLLGTTGAGGSSVFALDVTEPASFAAGDVLWEVNAGDALFADLGDTLGRASIARLPDGHFYAVFGNGFNSTSGNALIYLVRLDQAGAPDASSVQVLDTQTSGTANGMAAPLVADTDGDRIGDRIYAGDLNGNVWKLVWDDSDPDNERWRFAFSSGGAPSPLFQAQDAGGSPQPITARLQVRDHPAGGQLVLFGTGKFFETNDNQVGDNPQVQTFYGLRDDGSTAIAGRGELLEQSILGETLSGDFNVRVTSNLALTTERGWFMDLELPGLGGAGERVINQAEVRADRVVFTTLIPSQEVCAAGGTSWLMDLNAVSGARFESPIFDLDEDGAFDANDRVSLTLGGSTEDYAVAGIQRVGQGIFDNPAALDDGDTEVMLVGDSAGNLDSLNRDDSGDSGRQSWQQLR